MEIYDIEDFNNHDVDEDYDGYDLDVMDYNKNVGIIDDDHEMDDVGLDSLHDDYLLDMVVYFNNDDDGYNIDVKEVDSNDVSYEMLVDEDKNM